MSIWPSNRSRQLRDVTVAVSFAIAIAGCSLSDLVTAKPPATTLGREITQTEDGAIALVRSALTQFATVFNGSAQTYPAASYVLASGVFTDEFKYIMRISPEFDLRTPEGGIEYATARNALYSNMQYARATAQLARQALGTYGKNVSPFYRGMAIIMEAYTIIHLAEFFCSGVPLSDVSLDGDIQYRPGLPTNELLERAIVLLDSAIAITTDSVKMMQLARVAKGRALLSLGRYADAADAVRDVSPGFVYSTEHHMSIPALSNNFGRTFSAPLVHVTDVEGQNGMNWISANDPRLKLGAYFGSYYKPEMYATASTPTPLASAIEARLIEAEAAVHANDASWLAILNTLRTNGATIAAGCPTGRPAPCAAPGTGGVPGLAKLEDPGTEEGRIDLVFQERAFWLFATGHRQGDLRRLVRVYGRPQASVYPTGTYTNPLGTVGTGGTYGDIIALLVSPNERIANPKYAGCLNLTQ